MRNFKNDFIVSLKEMKNAGNISVSAMLIALSVILGYFTVSIGSFLKIGFSNIATQYAGLLLGPANACVFGAVSDIVKYFIKPTGEFFPGFTLNAMLAGLIYGGFYYKRQPSFRRIFIAELTVSVICNMLLGTLWLNMLYRKAFMALLPMRVLKNLCMLPINSFIFYTVSKSLPYIYRGSLRKGA